MHGLGTLGMGTTLWTKPPADERYAANWYKKNYGSGWKAGFKYDCTRYGFTRAKYGSSYDDKCIGHMYENNLGPWAPPAADGQAPATQPTPDAGGVPWWAAVGVAVGVALLARR